MRIKKGIHRIFIQICGIQRSLALTGLIHEPWIIISVICSHAFERMFYDACIINIIYVYTLLIHFFA